MMKKTSIILFFLITTMGISAQDKEVITAEHMWKMERVGAPDVSPDGLSAVFSVTVYDIDTDQPSSDIYMLNIENGNVKRLTYSGKESSPVFSPDGNKVAFVSRRHDGPGQIYILNLSGGEAKQLTDLPVGVFSLKWFPNGQKIAFGANVHPDYDGDFDKLKEIMEKKKESKVTAKVTENVMYRFWDKWLTDGYFPTLLSVEVESGKITDLMPDTFNYFGMMGGVSYDISPNGKQIALSMNSTEPPFEVLNYDVYLLEADGSGSMKNLTPDNKASDGNPVFSPDGSKIYYGKQSIYHFYADRMVITSYDIATGEVSSVTQDIDLSAQDWIFSENGKDLYFLAEYNAQTAIFSVPAEGGDHELIFGDGRNGDIKLAGSKKGEILFTHHNISSPAEIYLIDPKKKEVDKKTAFNDERVASLDLGEFESVTFKGTEDADVQMFIVYPPGFDPNKKYPLVLMLHGGPHGTFGNQWHYRWNAQLFAAPGYVVAMPNFHGSTSFGQEFAISIHGEHANKPFEDVMKATDYMIDKGFIDENNMAAAGGSYGGYLVSWIAGHTDRYAALVNHAGVYDLHLQFASDYAGNRGYQYSGTPWEGYDALNSQNPSQFSANFKTPMLVIHGELDYRVPVAQGLLVYGIYKGRGLDARLVYYPDENHWILRPQNSIYWYEELHNWFERYLKD